MSLINDVLRNLEAKRPDELAGHNLQREIRSLPPAARPRTGLRLLLVAGLVLAVGIAAWQWSLATSLLPQAEPVALPVAPPVAVSDTPPPVAPPSAAGLSQNLVLAQELLSLPLAEEGASPPPPVLPDTLKPALSLANAPAAAALSEVAPVSPAPPPVTVTAPPAPVQPPPTTVAKIEKSPVLATPRDRADADWRRGEAALASGRSEEAREALRSALRHDPGHLQVRQALLRNLLEARRLDEAIKVLQEGLELQPAQAGWAMSLARLQLEQSDVAAADATLARSQTYAESNADYAGFQGHLKTRLGSHRQAAAHYQRATRLAPNDGRWWLGLGLALEGDGRLPESREALRRALASGNLPAELASVAEQHLR
jgi:MSHA biogenesis protein MshN